jgi:hypothetical protein
MTTYHCPGAPGLKLGPGDPSTDLNAKPDPVDVIRFVNGYAEVAEGDPLREQKLAWIAGAGAYQIKEVSDLEAEAINDPTAINCPVDPERCEWRGPVAGHDWHILAHRPPDGEWYVPPRTVTRGTGF